MGKVIAFDVETPNSHNDRICSIGLSLIDDGTIVWSQNYMVNPECSFDNCNIQIHGIRPQDVEHAPTFPLIWEDIGSLFRQNLVIAHNATFDLCVLKKTLSAYGLSESLVYYACTMQMAQSILPDLPNFRLPTLCDYYNIDLDHHDSGSDSFACAQIFCHMLDEGTCPEDFTKAYSLECSHPASAHSQSTHMAANTKSLLTLSGILSGITCDNVLVPSEVEYLQNWLDDNVELKGNYPYDKIYTTIANALADGILEQAELESMLRLFKQVSDPVNDCSCNCSSRDISGKTFCLSGEFDYGEKSAVEELLIQRGGIPQKNVTRKTDLLIVGGQGSSAWCAGNYGTKVKKALELQEKGISIQIIREHDFL